MLDGSYDGVPPVLDVLCSTLEVFFSPLLGLADSTAPFDFSPAGLADKSAGDVRYRLLVKRYASKPMLYIDQYNVCIENDEKNFEEREKEFMIPYLMSRTCLRPQCS
jgi:hypothetical protein